jgi:hypothetical protein
MKLKYYLLLAGFIFLISCKKDFLSVKPDKNLVIPSTLKDLQALLDNADNMNSAMPDLGEISADDYYMSYDAWNSITYPKERNAYIWAKDLYEGTIPIGDWNYMYRIVFYANNVLEGLEKITRSNDPETYDHINGSALFFRAYAFYQLSQLYCAPYSQATASHDLGIPLRLKADINLPTKRATVDETYTRILSDLKASIPLLPNAVAYKTRPGKTAAYAMLSKIYLLMQNYKQSLLYADSAISMPTNQLINFNTINPSDPHPMQQNNEEVIFQTTLDYPRNFISSKLNIDSNLYNSYSDSDYRKSAWFVVSNGHLIFKGSYNGSSPYLFSGLALDEVYLNKAECLIRLGQIQEGMNTLNILLEKRFVSGSPGYTPPADEQDALSIVLSERRKELLMRGIRWSDLRRLNMDPQTAKTLIRILNGQEYELKPNSPNYVFPIQDDVIQISGIQQNVRE